MKSIFILAFTIFSLTINAQKSFVIDREVKTKQTSIIKHLQYKKGIDRAKKALFKENSNYKIVLLTDFSEGYAVARRRKSPLKGYVNRYYEWVIKPRNIEAEPVKDGRAVVRDLNDNYNNIKLN